MISISYEDFLMSIRDLHPTGDRTDYVGSERITITGWLAAVGEVRYLKDEEGDNLNRIAIFVRGKLAQEDILTDFSERGVYPSVAQGVGPYARSLRKIRGFPAEAGCGSNSLPVRISHTR